MPVTHSAADTVVNSLVVTRLDYCTRTYLGESQGDHGPSVTEWLQYNT